MAIVPFRLGPGDAWNGWVAWNGTILVAGSFPFEYEPAPPGDYTLVATLHWHNEQVPPASGWPEMDRLAVPITIE